MGVITRLQGQQVYPVDYFSDGGLVLATNRDFSATLYVLTKTNPEPPTRAEVLASGTPVAVQTSKYASSAEKCWMWAASSADCDVEFASLVEPAFEESENIRGFYNAKGLRRLIEQIPKAMTPGSGGIDTVWPGDSLLESMGVTSYLDDSIPAQFGKLVQAQFNPPGVPGGLGLAPVRSGNADNLYNWGGLQVLNSVRNMVWTANNTVTNTSSGNAISRKRVSFSLSTNQIRILLDPVTTSPSKRRGVTSIDLVYGQSNGTDSGAGITGGTFTYDLHNLDAFCAAGASGYSLTGTVNSNGTPSFGKRVQIGGTLDPTMLYSVQISGPATGTANIDGILCFNGDEATGWRNHNAGRVGANVTDSWTEETLYATYDAWCTRAGSPAGSRATNCYCFVGNLITNACATQTPIATFKAGLAVHYDRAIGLGACYWQIIPPVYDDGNHAKAIPYRAYKIAALEVIAERLEYMAVMDFDRWLGEPATDAYVTTTLGWVNTSMADHHTDIGAMGHAEVLFRCVLEAQAILAEEG